MKRHISWRLAATAVAVAATFSTVVPGFGQTGGPGATAAPPSVQKLIEFGLDTVGHAAKLEVQPPAVVGDPLRLDLDVASAIELPLTLDAVLGTVTTALTDPDPSKFVAEGPFKTSDTFAQPPADYPQADLPTKPVDPIAGATDPNAPQTVDPCKVLTELGYTQESATPNGKICPGDLDTTYNNTTSPPGQVATAAQDPGSQLNTKLAWEMAQLDRALTQLDQTQTTGLTNVELQELNRLIKVVADELNQVQLEQLKHLDIQAQEVLGKIGGMLDELVLKPSLPTTLPVRVCAQITVGDQPAVVHNGPAPLAAGFGPYVELNVAEEAEATPPASCGTNWIEVTPQQSLALSVVPPVAAAPGNVTADNLLEVAAELAKDTSVQVELKLLAELDQTVLERRFSAPRVTVPVPALPVPDLAVAFGGVNHGHHHLSNWYGLAVIAPPASPLESVSESMELLRQLQGLVNDVRTTIDRVPGTPDPVKSAYTALGNALNLVVNDQPLGEGPSYLGQLFVRGNDHHLEHDGWVERPGLEDDIGLNDDIRSFVFFGPTQVWCWYQHHDYSGADYAITAATAPGFVRIVGNTAEELGKEFGGTGEGLNWDGVSSWQWASRHDRTMLQPGSSPEGGFDGCRTGGLDKHSPYSVAR